ncbi:hypothetical protein GA830_00775 [Mesorhizobium sp. NBSH29]|uniref:hypothetical protein n=1 Tax=Mesorhizobium sp. NBSH29 TaxID=2654249 RepID=UPI0018968B15|nr:hypothetical protein [Mesorhizobium sp. NBSH29]QPC85439.1 hypothetical protein GA830_00775 [Mesorhizobium sp. NBSH29]
MATARTMIAASSIVATALLAGCMSSGPDGGGSGRVMSRAVSVEGEWMSSDGVAISRFSGGAFETVATDTGNKLADGNYRMANERAVDITVISLIRQTTTNVTCAIATADQLNCTSSGGQTFVLNRRKTAGA